MASPVGSASSQQPTKGGLSLFSSDQEILNQIYFTHVHVDEPFDVDSLFIVVENILKRTTHIADSIVLGTPATVEHLEEKIPNPSFNPPLCTLKHISCGMQCKAPDEETAFRTALSILNKLSRYSWDAKAVLTLAAFALDYGDFWLLAQTQSTDQLAKSVGTLRRVPVLLRGTTLQKHRHALIELNTLIRATLEVIECIIELEKLSNYDIVDIPALSTGMDHIPVDVFWAIVTVVASTTQLCCLTSDGDEKQQLSQFSQKLNVILTKLRYQIKICRQQIEELNAHRRLVKLLRTPAEVMEVLKALIYTKDNVQTLIDGSIRKPVNIDVLKRKNVLLFISGLDISHGDISVLNPIYDSIRKDGQYKIVWIPIVDQWTEDLQKKFEILRSKMPWYVVQCFSPIVGIRFIKEKWHFKGEPVVVVLKPQGKVEHENAMHMIRIWGVRAFPFTAEKEEKLSHGKDWIGSIASCFHPDVDKWFREQRYIFFYGGEDRWIQQFTEKATALANDVVIKNARISIVSQCVGKGSKEEDNIGMLGRFWSSIESMFISMTHRKTEADAVTQEIQKLLSYKNESGWVVLTKGSEVVLSGHCTAILAVLEEFDKWKESVSEKGFELAFKEHYNKVLPRSHICCRIDITSNTGKMPENIKCPGCPRIMKTYISLKCCHIDGAANGLH